MNISYPCLMIGKEKTLYHKQIFIMAINEVDRTGTTIDAILLNKPSKDDNIGDNYKFRLSEINRYFTPYHGLITINSEEVNINLP